MPATFSATGPPFSTAFCCSKFKIMATPFRAILSGGVRAGKAVRLMGPGSGVRQPAYRRRAHPATISSPGGKSHVEEHNGRRGERRRGGEYAVAGHPWRSMRQSTMNAAIENTVRRRLKR